MQNNQPKRYYKIEVGDNIIVYRNDVGNRAFYKCMITRKNKDNTKERFYKEIKFKQGVDIEDKTLIKIKDFFEDVRENPRDKYNPIFSLFILDYEILENPFDKNEAIANYNKSDNEEIDDSYFDDVAENSENIDTPF